MTFYISPVFVFVSFYVFLPLISVFCAIIKFYLSHLFLIQLFLSPAHSLSLNPRPFLKFKASKCKIHSKDF